MSPKCGGRGGGPPALSINSKQDCPQLQIQKRDIDLPEFLKVAVDDLPDYPPRFLIHVEKKSPEELITNPPKLLIHGLDVKDFSFKLPTSSESTRTLSQASSSGYIS